jgi:hypothetical protein
MIKCCRTTWLHVFCLSLLANGIIAASNGITRSFVGQKMSALSPHRQLIVASLVNSALSKF